VRGGPQVQSATRRAGTAAPRRHGRAARARRLDWEAGTLLVSHSVKRIKERGPVATGRRTALVVSELKALALAVGRHAELVEAVELRRT
jgi:hypothetical protein